MSESTESKAPRESEIAPGVMFTGMSFAEEGMSRDLARNAGQSFVSAMTRPRETMPQGRATRPKPAIGEVVAAHNARVQQQRETDRIGSECQARAKYVQDRLKAAKDGHSAAQARYLAELGGPLEGEAREALAAARQERQDAEDLATVPIPRTGAENLPGGALKRSLTHTFEQIALAEVAAIQNSGEVIAALKTAFAAKGIAARGCSWPEFLAEVFGSGEPRGVDPRTERAGLIAKYGVLE